MKGFLFLTVATMSARGAVIYDFSGIGNASPPFPAEPVAFRLYVADFVNPPASDSASPVFVSFSCSQLDSSTNCNPIFDNAISFANLTSFGSVLGVAASNGAAYGFIFPAGAFDTPGIYAASFANVGTLTVTETPEPTSSLLFLSAIGLYGLRRLVNRPARS